MTGVHQEGADAEALAGHIRTQGFNPLLLFSSDYGSLNPGHWVTHIGRFSDRATADDTTQRLRRLG